jgi:hypothetical protein
VRELAPGAERTQAPSATPAWLEVTLAGHDNTAVPTLGASPNMAAAEGSSSPPSPEAEPCSAPARLATLRYKVQFTADQAYVDLLERARDLLEHQVPDRDLASVQRLAIEALLDKLNRLKYGVRNTAGGGRCGPAPDAAPDGRSDEIPVVMVDSRAPEMTGPEMTAPPETAPPEMACAPQCGPSRHLPAALRRSVVERDEGRCSYVDSRGVRCRETARLEFHHERAHGLGGATVLDNIKLRCRAHNDLAAELDFGRAFMEGKQRGEPPSGFPSAAPARNGGSPTERTWHE